MKVSDILRVKGGTLFTADPQESLMHATQVMSEKDLGSLVSSTMAMWWAC